jgi:hypothetical protein
MLLLNMESFRLFLVKTGNLRVAVMEIISDNNSG